MPPAKDCARGDFIGCDRAGTIPGLFRERAARTPDEIAYLQYESSDRAWRCFSWQEMSDLVQRWQAALAAERLSAGDRVAVLLANSIEWVSFDLAALSLGLVVTPLYLTDSASGQVHVVQDSGAKLLLLDSAGAWAKLAPQLGSGGPLQRVLCLNGDGRAVRDDLLRNVAAWLPPTSGGWIEHPSSPDDLATIVYTSGTTGRPKGVMLTHHSLLWDAEAVQQGLPARRDDVFLSVLPAAHIFERIVGYYLPMMAGSRVAFARSLHSLPKDLLTVRPTALLMVPRFYERIYVTLRQRCEKSWLSRHCLRWAEAPSPSPLGQLARWVLARALGRRLAARFGGRLRVAVSGGGRISTRAAGLLVALGLPIVEGYGLTEAGAVTGNTLEDNEIGSVGKPLRGVEVSIDGRGELLVRSPCVMQGYWRRPDATRTALDRAGWLHTGDLADVKQGRVYLRGRLDQVLVSSRGENIAAADLESAILLDPLFEQAMVVGHGRPFPGAVLVLNPQAWRDLATELSLAPEAAVSLRAPQTHEAVLARLAKQLSDLPRYARVRAVHLTLETWTTENDMLTATMKPKRHRLEQHFAEEIAALYGRRAVAE